MIREPSVRVRIGEREQSLNFPQVFRVFSGSGQPALFLDIYNLAVTLTMGCPSVALLSSSLFCFPLTYTAHLAMCRAVTFVFFKVNANGAVTVLTISFMEYSVKQSPDGWRLSSVTVKLQCSLSKTTRKRSKTGNSYQGHKLPRTWPHCYNPQALTTQGTEWCRGMLPYFPTSGSNET